MQPKCLTLLVDETALSDHLKIMVVGIWTAGGCVPIAWWSYQPQHYPTVGQVGVISELLDRVVPVMPFPMPIWLLADRGIGTSPDLVKAMDNRGVLVVFRVQGSTRFRAADGREYALAELGVKGKSWQAAGEVFKKAGWLSATATVAWGTTYDAPLCLVSSQAIDPHLYARRFDQEVSFRDFKSDGFQWQRSHVWLPDHSDRLLLVIAMAYWLVMSVGQLLAPAPTGCASRWSCFRRGWEACRVLFRPTIAVLLPPPVPPPRFLTSVVY
jgi:hypothetical protein